MSAKRFTGKTESDAVMNAAMELGSPSTDLKYTVIDSGSNGFFGLFKKPVIIEINEEEKKEWRRICKIPVPTWKRLLVYYICKWLNVYYESQPQFHLNMKGNYRR